MRIISNFKDYYDFAAAAARDRDFREVVYLRKTELKMEEIALQTFEYIRHTNRYYASNDKIISKWWENNEKTLTLPNMPSSVRAGCFFVCGKAYPFLFLRDTATIGTEGKSGQVRLSKNFSETIKHGIDRKKDRAIWEKDKKYEDEFNFFKTYFTEEEFLDDIIIEEHSWNSRYSRNDNTLRKKLKYFFEYYDGKDFTELHLRLDCPLLLTVFHNNGRKFGDWQENSPKDYEFILNPNLYEFDFMRVMSGELLAQEIEMFLGNTLIKDIMPPSYQSDLDKVTSHGFDPKISFRKYKGS